MNLKLFAALWTAGVVTALGVLWKQNPEAFAEGFPILAEPIGFFKSYNPIGILLGFGGLAAALVIEWWAVGWDDCAINKLKRGSASNRRDVITCTAYVLGIWNAIGYTATLGASFYLGGYIAKYYKVEFIGQIPTDIGKAVTTTFVLGFFEYWAHRWSHTNKALWALHKYHHSATEMSIFSAHRNNPFSGPVMAVITTIPFSFLGGNFASFAWIGGIRILLDYIIHSEIKNDWGWLGRWLLVSPAAHRVHHSADSKHFNSNYGFFLIFWDRVFGTYNPAKDVNSFGAPDPLFNKVPVGEEMVASLYRAVSGYSD